MYCPKCGKELPEDAQFCPHCGNSVSSPAVPSRAQDSSGHEKDIPVPEQPSAPPVSQPVPPPVPDEEIKCPKCGASGCTPQYKQNVSGGGYGCCQGVLGSLILGPLGLLCGMCGRSVKTSNQLVWICPKCGHEFRVLSEDDKKRICRGCILSLLYTGALLVISAIYIPPLNILPSHYSSDNVFTLLLIIIDIFCIGLTVYSIKINVAKKVINDEQKEKLKKIAVAIGVASILCFLISALFCSILRMKYA